MSQNEIFIIYVEVAASSKFFIAPIISSMKMHLDEAKFQTRPAFNTIVHVREQTINCVWSQTYYFIAAWLPYATTQN